MTYSETEEGGALLKIHVDTNNDDTLFGQAGNYNYVICAWNCIRMPDLSWDTKFFYQLSGGIRVFGVKESAFCTTSFTQQGPS